MKEYFPTIKKAPIAADLRPTQTAAAAMNSERTARKLNFLTLKKEHEAVKNQ